MIEMYITYSHSKSQNKLTTSTERFFCYIEVRLQYDAFVSNWRHLMLYRCVNTPISNFKLKTIQHKIKLNLTYIRLYTY